MIAFSWDLLPDVQRGTALSALCQSARDDRTAICPASRLRGRNRTRAGYAKTQQVEVHHVHEILRRFTPDELDRYGRTGDYPDRFADIFRQLEGPKDSGSS
jgi:hypothetical protein